MTSNAERYTKLEARAASGDRKAAEELIRREWWPGNPSNPTSVDRVIEGAKRRAAEAVKIDRYRRQLLTTMSGRESAENHYADLNGLPRPHVIYLVHETSTGKLVARARAGSSELAASKVARMFNLDEGALNASPEPAGITGLEAGAL